MLVVIKFWVISGVSVSRSKLHSGEAFGEIKVIP